jgi:hypothetical protein
MLVHCVQQYCYCRERKYCPFDDLNDFGCVIKVKEHAPDLHCNALTRCPHPRQDVVDGVFQGGSLCGRITHRRVCQG